MKHFFAIFLIFLFLFAYPASAEPLALTYHESDYPDGGTWLCNVSFSSAMEIRLPHGFEALEASPDDEIAAYTNGDLFFFNATESFYKDADAYMKSEMSSWKNVVCNGVPAVMGHVVREAAVGETLYAIDGNTLYTYILLRRGQDWTEEDAAEALRIFSSFRPSDKTMPTPTPQTSLPSLPPFKANPDAENRTEVSFGNDDGIAFFRLPAGMTKGETQRFYGETNELAYLTVADSDFDEFTSDCGLTWETETSPRIGSAEDEYIELRAKALSKGNSWFVLLYGEWKDAWKTEGEARCQMIFDSFRLLDEDEIEQLKEKMI